MGYFFCLKKSSQASKGSLQREERRPSLMLTRGKPWSLFQGPEDSPEILKCGAVDRYSLGLACEMLLFFQVSILL